MLFDVWSENAALFKRLLKINSNPPIPKTIWFEIHVILVLYHTIGSKFEEEKKSLFLNLKMQLVLQSIFGIRVTHTVYELILQSCISNGSVPHFCNLLM